MNHYRNRWTAFFSRELNKGFGSPYCIVAFGIITSLTAYKVMNAWIVPQRERVETLAPRSRIPMQAGHEAMWGFPSTSSGNGMPDEVRPGAAIFDPSVAVSESEGLLRRPRLIYAERATPAGVDSEANDDSASGKATRDPMRGINDTTAQMVSDEEAVVMEIPEFDSQLRDDVYYRSLHYLATRTKEPAQSAPASSSSGDTYFSAMPGQGREHIHGLVKCRRIDYESAEAEGGVRGPTGATTDGESASWKAVLAAPCIPYAGDLARELSRKLLLALGPAHVLQDPNKRVFPARFSTVKQPEVRALIVGMRGGELPRWLSAAYPNFVVDVVEPDTALIRLVKRFFGLKEGPKLRVVPMEPMGFVRSKASEVESSVAASETSVQLRALFIPWKRGPTTRATALGGGSDDQRSPVEDPRPYDIVLMDALDHRGELPTFFGRLDFIQHVRQIMSPTGCVAVAVPNRDANFLFNMVQHWRMGFHGRSMLLCHCHQEPVTVLITFQDEGGRGQGNMGILGSAEEMKDLIRSHLTHYGIDRVPQFDLTREVDGGSRGAKDASGSTGAGGSGGFFTILEPGRRYTMADYLPPGHPFLLSRGQTERGAGRWWWQPWLQRLSGKA